jgi:hypothetical protein
MDSHGSGSGRGRTRRRVAIGVVAATVALLAVTILPSSAASSVPQLKLTQTASGWTKVAWTFTSSDHAQDMQLQIDRGPDAAHFAKWLVINRPEKNSFRYDKDGKPTTVYRARLSVKGVFGGWSNPISLAGVGSTAPPSTPPTTTVKPTTTTTVKPTTKTTTVPVTTHACSDAAKADVLRFINTERAKVGAKPLVMNAELAAAAQAHTAWMVKNNVRRTRTASCTTRGWAAPATKPRCSIRSSITLGSAARTPRPAGCTTGRPISAPTAAEVRFGPVTGRFFAPRVTSCTAPRAERR